MYAVTHSNRSIICIFPSEDEARDYLMQRATRAALESFRDFRAVWLICTAPRAGGVVGGEIGRVVAERAGRTLSVTLTGPAT